MARKKVQGEYINSVNLKDNTDFPYLVVNVVNDRSHPRNPGFLVMHWHEDLQFIYVQDGKIAVQTLDETSEIEKGQAVFINQNVVHDVKRIGDCRYTGFLFPAYFLAFYEGGPGRAFVERITDNEQISLFRFDPSVDWQDRVIDLLIQLADLETSPTEDDLSEAYSYEVLVRLSQLWLTLGKNLDIPPIKEERPIHLRMQKILSYIKTHYSEDLTLADLAQSANISKSECARCFRESLNTTPYQYLTEFRLSRAAQLLKNTDEPIGAIAAHVGFHQMSHFGKCFKAKTGYSPKAYRKEERYR